MRPRWSGLLVGAQGAVLSLLAIVMPVLAVFVATATDPATEDVSWTRAAATGATLWLLAHGGVAQTATATFSLVPLGLTVLAGFGCYASARRAHADRSWPTAVVGYLLVLGLTVVLLGGRGPLGVGGGAVVRTLVGASLVAAVGFGLGTLRSAGVAERLRPAWHRLPGALQSGVAGGVLVAAALVTLAGALVAVWAVAGRSAVGDVIVGLDLDLGSGFLLALAQLALVPNLVVWAVAWLAGPGFVVGSGSSYAPAELVTGSLPALPLLGGLPSTAGGPVRWAPLVVVAVGAVAGWWLRGTGGIWRATAAGVITGVTAGLVVGALVLAASGSAGPGRLAEVGAQGLPVAAMVAALAGAGAIAVAVPRAARAARGAGAARAGARTQGSES